SIIIIGFSFILIFFQPLGSLETEIERKEPIEQEEHNNHLDYYKDLEIEDGVEMLDQEQFSEEHLSSHETNDRILQSFLDDLFGEEYAVLRHLIATERYIEAETLEEQVKRERELQQEVNTLIKKDRDLTQYIIVDHTHLPNDKSNYKVELSFDDGDVDLMEVEIKDQAIQTPFDEMIIERDIVE
ncbi:hypothetical protein, partial [Leifsonia shinshuensis]|uniref:hypothetical protein n=1 Tax=Leifsonia shinshuensis TaxID=150026 RepID=UPI0035E97A4B